MTTLLASPTRPKTSTEAPKRARAKRGWGKSLLLLLTAAVLVGGWATWRAMQPAAAGELFTGEVQTAKVRNGLMRVTVNDDGNVESAANVDVKCEVEGGSQILWIVEEGAEVKAGDDLVRLDSSLIEQQITEQTIIFEKAQAELIRAREDASVAAIALKEYEDGTFKKEQQTAEANIVIARENLKNSENLLSHNERMFRKGYINRLQLETSQFAVQRNKLELDAMTTARLVLVEYTKPKMLMELKSKRDAAEANVRAMQAAADLEKSKLGRLQDQLNKCTIKAPQPGLVVYANEQSRRGSEETRIEEGAKVRQYQNIVQLPDLTKMQVKSLIHETKIDKVRIGMPSTIRIRGRELVGNVVHVKTQPESTNWFSPDVKDYAAIVSIENADSKAMLKPGMTAEVEILIKEIPEAIQVPLLGVVQEGVDFVSYVKTETGYDRRPVKVGASNTSFIQIKEGLSAGEEVILNPRYCVAEAGRRAAEMARQLQKEKKGPRDAQSTQPREKTAQPSGAIGGKSEQSLQQSAPVKHVVSKPSEQKSGEKPATTIPDSPPPATAGEPQKSVEASTSSAGQ